jgi:electron transport complex protein RnfB
VEASNGSSLPVEQLAKKLWALLPQTQCQRCSYIDCQAYAVAMAQGDADINQCPPGGSEGVSLLAGLLNKPIRPLNPANGTEGPRSLVFIDEAWCIGCTLCIGACPTDAIIGTHKHMHTVQEAHCTGCELCLPVCPVDCIVVENASGTATGWSAWSNSQAENALNRYEFRSNRLKRGERERHLKHQKTAQTKLADLAAHSHIADPIALERKRAIIEAAMARAREKHGATKV